MDRVTEGSGVHPSTGHKAGAHPARSSSVSQAEHTQGAAGRGQPASLCVFGLWSRWVSCGGYSHNTTRTCKRRTALEQRQDSNPQRYRCKEAVPPPQPPCHPSMPQCTWKKIQIIGKYVQKLKIQAKMFLQWLGAVFILFIQGKHFISAALPSLASTSLVSCALWKWNFWLAQLPGIDFRVPAVLQQMDESHCRNIKENQHCGKLYEDNARSFLFA